MLEERKKTKKKTKKKKKHFQNGLLSFRHYQEVKKGLLQWKVWVKALPRVTTRPWPPDRLRSTTTRGICTSWMGLLLSFRACVRFNTCGQTALQE